MQIVFKEHEGNDLGIARKKRTFLKDEWADIKKKGFIGRDWSVIQMIENKMEQVANLFGKELCEDFTINFYGRLFDVTFDEDGLKVFSDTLFEDELSRLLLEGLILGNAVIVEDV